MTQLNETPRTKARLRAALLLAITFVAGVVLGVAGDRFSLLRQHRMVPRGGYHFATDRILARLDRELALTDEQRAKVEQILERRSKAIEAIWAPVQPELRREMARGNDEIAAILTPEQKAKFARLRERWKRHASMITGPDSRHHK